MAAVSYFDLVKDMFTANVAEKYTKETLRQFGFLLNRTCAIQYPLQAQLMNRLCVNYPDVAGVWNRMLYNGKRPPSWIFTKGAKKAREESSSGTVSKALMDEYCRWYGLRRGDVDFAMEMFPEETKAEILEYERVIKNGNGNK